MKILVPSCGNSEFFKDSYYPKNIVDIKGKPMIQHIIENYKNVEISRFIFAFLQSECDKFHVDNVVNILTNHECDIIRLKGRTRGALCTSLMAIEYINNDESLIITNNDQIYDIDLNDPIRYFMEQDIDCGVICFESVHPRWSYVRVSGDLVVEAAEKRPLSNYAIGGWYYFKKGSDFIEAAKNAIKKECTFEENFYISAAINEEILKNRRVGFYSVPAEKYHSFYSPERINEYLKGENDR